MNHYSAALTILLLAELVYILRLRSGLLRLKANLSAALDSSHALTQRLELVESSRDSRLRRLEQKAEAQDIATTEARRQRDDMAVQLSQLINERANKLAKLHEQESRISRLEDSLSRSSGERAELESKFHELEQRLTLLADLYRSKFDADDPTPGFIANDGQSQDTTEFPQNASVRNNSTPITDASSSNEQPDYIVFDIETTGFSNDDEIVEIALIHATPHWREVARLETTIRASRTSGTEALKTHGLAHEMLIESPLFADISHGLANFIDRKILVAHNLGFDRRFLERSFGRVTDLAVDLGNGIDTLSSASKDGPRRLEELCQLHGIAINRVHSAMGDAEALLKLLEGGHIEPRITGQQIPVTAKGLTRPGDIELRPRSVIRVIDPIAPESLALADPNSSSWPSRAPTGFRLGPTLTLKPLDKVCCSCLNQKSSLRDSLYKKHADLGLNSARSVSDTHVCIVVEDFSSKADKVRDALARGIPLVAASDFLSYQFGSVLQSWLPESSPVN